jgi:hypothetical protein
VITGRFTLVAFQTLGFAGDASYVGMLVVLYRKCQMLSGLANDKSGKSRNLPLRLLDCFLLVTPVVSDAFGASLLAESGLGAAFLAVLTLIGTISGDLSASEGDGTVTVSAICHCRESVLVC